LADTGPKKIRLRWIVLLLGSLSAAVSAMAQEAKPPGAPDCSCTPLPSRGENQSPAAGVVRNELAERDLEAILSNRDRVYGGWTEGLRVLAHDIDPAGTFNIFRGTPPMPVAGAAVLQEGGDSGLWTGHPLPAPRDYLGQRDALQARNPWSWQIMGNTFAEALLATMARCWRHGCAEPALRHDLQVIGRFLGETLVHSAVPPPLAIVPGTRPGSSSPPPPADPPEAQRFDREAADLRAMAAAARERADAWKRLADRAKATLDSVRDPVNKEVWQATLDRETAEALRIAAQAEEFELAAAAKAKLAASLRAASAPPPPAIATPAPDARAHAALAAKFGADFRLAVLWSLGAADPKNLQLAAMQRRSTAYPFSSPPKADELPLDVFDIANAALDVISWRDAETQSDAGWLTPVRGEGGGGGWGDLIHVLALVASGGSEFSAASLSVGARQNAVACKAFDILVRLADSAAPGAEAFQRGLMSMLIEGRLQTPQPGGGTALQRVARNALMATGFATPELARSSARWLVLNATGDTRDQSGTELPAYLSQNDFYIDAAILLSAPPGAANRPTFGAEFTDEIKTWTAMFQEYRTHGFGGTKEQLHFLDRWNSQGTVLAGAAPPPGCRVAVAAAVENSCRGPLNPPLLSQNFNPDGPVAPHPTGRVFRPGNLEAGEAFWWLYRFYNGSQGRTDFSSPTDPWNVFLTRRDAVIIEGDTLTQLQQLPTVIANLEDAPRKLDTDANDMFGRLSCGQAGKFTDRGHAAFTHETESLISGLLLLAFGSYNVYWEGSCETGPKRCCFADAKCESGSANTSLYTCKINWTFYKSYNFGQYGTGTGGTVWLKRLNFLGWFGQPFGVFGYWEQVINGRNHQCIFSDAQSTPSVLRPR
jgi:hypothetical protein